MQSSKPKKMKKTLIFGGIYLLFSAALLLGIGTAKYNDAKLAYFNYGAASFNSVILGDCTDGTITAFGKTLCADDCLPGMTYSGEAETNTAKLIPFSIANGVSDENASDVGVSYSVRLRTTKNLPLRFTLASIDSKGTVTLYRAGDPEIVENNADTGSAIVWYEWTFYEDIDDDEPSEAIFSLAGGDLSKIDHQMIVEWPITEKKSGIPDNSSEYMKEIDLMEVLVTVSSKNYLDKEDLEITAPVDVRYGNGIIILDPSIEPDAEDEEHPYHYHYTFDLRAFHAESSENGETDSKFYDFTVSNGVGIGKKQETIYTEYVIELKAPYTVSDPENDALPTMDYDYDLLVYDSADKTYKSTRQIQTSEFRLYYEPINDPNNKYGTYRVVDSSELTDENLAKWTAEKSQMRLYKIYFFTANAENTFRLLNKAADNEGNYADRADSSDFRLVLTNAKVNLQTAFENKLELLIKAAQTGGTGIQEQYPDEEDADADADPAQAGDTEGDGE